MSKMSSFLTYLCMVKFNDVWKPNRSQRDIRRLQDENAQFSAAPWINSTLLQSEAIHGAYFDFNMHIDARGTMAEEESFRPNRIYVSNLNWASGCYSIWERMSTEELLACRQMLESGAQNAASQVTHTMLESSNENFAELLQKSEEAETQLSKSKLELLAEA